MQMDNKLPNWTSQEYWDRCATDWNGEIQNTMSEDMDGVLVSTLEEHLQAGDKCIDFGCGVGLYLPELAQRCKRVIGIDISRKCVEVARKRCLDEGHMNVTLRKGDLANIDLRKKGIPDCDMAVCANVLISPEPTTRMSILKNIHTNLRPGGRLMLLVPAVESAKLCWKTHIEWVKHVRENKLPLKPEDEAPEERNLIDTRAGVYRRDGVRTKHFKGQELRTALKKIGFTVVSLDKVQYAWSSELSEPTDFLSSPYPFDWLALCTRNVEEQT
jgi:SAM-dependent methyltransferase